MMPIWIFAVFIILFIGVLLWERLDYIVLRENTGILEHYLDLYIKKFGPSFGIIVEEDPEKDIDVSTK